MIHFARVVDDAKCIVVTRVCVCLSVRGRMPTLLHDPGCKLGSGRGCPLVVHYLPDLQSLHGLHCYSNMTRTRNVTEYVLVVLVLCLVFVQQVVQQILRESTKWSFCFSLANIVHFS